MDSFDIYQNNYNIDFNFTQITDYLKIKEQNQIQPQPINSTPKISSFLQYSHLAKGNKTDVILYPTHDECFRPIFHVPLNPEERLVPVCIKKIDKSNTIDKFVKRKLDNTILSSNYTILKSSLTERQIETLKKQLTLENKQEPHSKKEQEKKEKYTYWYKETNTELIVPRYFGLTKVGKPDVIDIWKGKKIKVDFVKQLHEEQQIVCDIILSHLKNEERMPGGIIMCPCGFGKTVCLIYILCKLGLKAIVTAKQTEHVNNFIEEVKVFAPSMRIGIIKDKKTELEDVDIVVCTAHVLLARFVEKPDEKPDKKKKRLEYIEKMKTFGVWASDEMHHDAATSFAKLNNVLKMKYRIGLTATPRRADGNIPALFWNFGPILCKIKRVHKDVICKIVKYMKGSTKEIKAGKAINKARMINIMTKDFKRNEHIADEIMELLLNPSPKPITRKIIAITDRLSQIGLFDKKKEENMSEEIKKRNLETSVYGYLIKKLLHYFKDKDAFLDTSISNVHRIMGKKTDKSKPLASSSPLINIEKKGKKGKNEQEQKEEQKEEEYDEYDEYCSIGWIVGKRKSHEIQNAKKCRIIFASFPEANENLNVPLLDTIVIMSPRSDLEQAIGRILRLVPNKNTPYVVFYWNPFSIFEFQGYKIINYLKEESWKPFTIEVK